MNTTSNFMHKFLITASAIVAAVLSIGLSQQAGATLIGDTVTITSNANLPLDTWSDTVLVGAGIELMGGDGSNHSLSSLSVVYPHLFSGDYYDIGANSITINFAALGGLGFPYAFTSVFTDLDWQGTPGTLQSVLVAGGATGLIASNISSITTNSFVFQGTVDLVAGANFTLNLTAIHDENQDPEPEDDDEIQVPEPASLALLGFGLLSLGAVRRRRKTS